MMSDISSSESVDGTEGSQELFEVEKICGHRWADDGKSYEYRVKWKNYPCSDNTWEPIEHLSGCRQVLKTYQLRVFGRVLLSDSSSDEASSRNQDDHVFLTDRDVFTTGTQESGSSKVGPILANHSLKSQLETFQSSSQESEKSKKRSKRRSKKAFKGPHKGKKKKERSPEEYNELMRSITSDTGMETELEDEVVGIRKSKKKKKGGRVVLEEDLESDSVVELPAEPDIKKNTCEPVRSPSEVPLRPSNAEISHLIELNSADESATEEVSWADRLRLEAKKSVQAATSSKENEPRSVNEAAEAPERPPTPKVTKKKAETPVCRASKTSRPPSREQNQEEAPKMPKKRGQLLGAMNCGVEANKNPVVDAPRDTTGSSVQASGSLQQNRAANPVQAPVQAPSLYQGTDQPRIVNQPAPAPQNAAPAPKRPPSLYQGGAGVQNAPPPPNIPPQREENIAAERNENIAEVPQIVDPQRPDIVLQRPIENAAHREDPLPAHGPIDPPIFGAHLPADEFIRQLELQPLQRPPAQRQPAERRISDSIPSDPIMTPRSESSQLVVNQPPPTAPSTAPAPRRSNLPPPPNDFRPIPQPGQEQNMDQAMEAFRALDPRLRDRGFHPQLPMNVSAEEFFEIIDPPDEPVDRKAPVYIPEYMRISSPHFDPERMRNENRERELPPVPRIDRRNVREMFDILEQMRRRAAEDEEDPMLRYEGPSVSADEVRSAVSGGQGIRRLLPNTRPTEREFRDVLRQRDEELLDGQEIPQSPESLPSTPRSSFEIEPVLFQQDEEEGPAPILEREHIRIDPVEFGPSQDGRIEGLDTPGPLELPVQEARSEAINGHGEDNLDIDVDQRNETGDNVAENSTQSDVDEVQADDQRNKPLGNEEIDHQQNASAEISASNEDNPTRKPSNATVLVVDTVPLPFQMQDASDQPFCLVQSTMQPLNISLVDTLNRQPPTTSSAQIPPQILARTTELDENITQPAEQLSPDQQKRQNKRKKSHPTRCVPLTENELEAMNSQAVALARPTENLDARSAPNLVAECDQCRENEGQIQTENPTNPLEEIARMAEQFNAEALQLQARKKHPVSRRLSDGKRTDSNSRRSSNQGSQITNTLPPPQSILPSGNAQQSPKRRSNQACQMTPQMLAQYQQMARQGNQPNMGNFINAGQIPNGQIIQPGPSLAQRTSWPRLPSLAGQVECQMAGQVCDISNPSPQMNSPAQMVSPAQNMTGVGTPNSSLPSPTQRGSGFGNSGPATTSPAQQGQVLSLPNSQLSSPAQQIAVLGSASPSMAGTARNRAKSGNSGGMVHQQGFGMPSLSSQVPQIPMNPQMTVQAQQRSNRTQTLTQSMMNQIHQQIFTQKVMTTQTNQMVAQPQLATNSAIQIPGTSESTSQDPSAQSEVRDIVQRLKDMDEQRRQDNPQAHSLTPNIPMRLFQHLARTNGPELVALSQALQKGQANLQGLNSGISRPRGAQQGVPNAQGFLQSTPQGIQPQMLSQFEQALHQQKQLEYAEYMRKLQQAQQMQVFGQAQQGLMNPQQGQMPALMGQGNFQQTQRQLQYSQGHVTQSLAQFAPNVGQLNAQGQFQQQAQPPKQRRTSRQGPAESQSQLFPAPYQENMNVQGLQALGQMANPQQMQQRPQNFAQSGFHSSTGSMGSMAESVGSMMNNSAGFGQVTTQSMVHMQFPPQQASMAATQMQMPFQQQQMIPPQGYVQVVERERQVYVQNFNPQSSFNSSNCSNPEQMFGQSNFSNSSGSASAQVTYNPALLGPTDGALPQFFERNS
ncbi:unnamed protein product [Bursaphelenchus xylophilus]|uniref:(pine wood nematode) hypothetical protein n=1 Tax=Bursaphelenchus xylophilus TaxID=6326 RepID=A0A7I8WMQ0_BURXY|nr:unnamed protein product [Bursaphelenchus xylophilus]CAG9104086.1 unnamed protein product [Bursaphelenchus xylophilus]